MSHASASFDQRLFGLLVRSNLPIPYAVRAGGGDADVVCTFGELPEWAVAAEPLTRPRWRDDAPYALDRLGDAFALAYADGTRFVIVRDAVWMTWRAPLNFDDACTYLVGAAFALLVRMRGAACLHASAVTLDDRTVAIAGPSGAGKSTLAAALVRRGGTLVAEDVLPLVAGRGRIDAVPSYGGIRLWPSGVELLTGSRDALPPISPTWDKRMLAPERIATEPRPLGAVVFLDDRDEELTAGAAAMRLVANSYRPEMLEPEMRRTEFAIFGDAAASLRMRALARSERPPELLAEMVIDACAAV